MHAASESGIWARLKPQLQLVYGDERVTDLLAEIDRLVDGQQLLVEKCGTFINQKVAGARAKSQVGLDEAATHGMATPPDVVRRPVNRPGS